MLLFNFGSSGGIQNIGKHKVVNLKIVTNGFQKIQIIKSMDVKPIRFFDINIFF